MHSSHTKLPANAHPCVTSSRHISPHSHTHIHYKIHIRWFGYVISPLAVDFVMLVQWPIAFDKCGEIQLNELHTCRVYESCVLLEMITVWGKSAFLEKNCVVYYEPIPPPGVHSHVAFSYALECERTGNSSSSRNSPYTGWAAKCYRHVYPLKCTQSSASTQHQFGISLLATVDESRVIIVWAHERTRARGKRIELKT